MLSVGEIRVNAIAVGSRSIPYSTPYALRVALVSRLSISTRIPTTV